MLTVNAAPTVVVSCRMNDCVCRGINPATNTQSLVCNECDEEMQEALFKAAVST